MTKLINESVSFLYEILFANWHFEVAKYFKMAYLTVSSQREIISAKIWENFNWGETFGKDVWAFMKTRRITKLIYCFAPLVTLADYLVVYWCRRDGIYVERWKIVFKTLITFKILQAKLT